MRESVSQTLALAVLKGYKLIVSPWLAPSCRFVPTCSEYASDAVRRYGVIRAIGKTLWRLLRCHPFHRGGLDPA